jgi:hypothetical protein
MLSWRRSCGMYGPHNAETLLVDPPTDDVFLVVKSGDGHSSVFVARAPLVSGRTMVLEQVATLRFGCRATRRRRRGSRRRPRGVPRGAQRGLPGRRARRVGWRVQPAADRAGRRKTRCSMACAPGREARRCLCSTREPCRPRGARMDSGSRWTKLIGIREIGLRRDPWIDLASDPLPLVASHPSCMATATPPPLPASAPSQFALTGPGVSEARE